MAASLMIVDNDADMLALWEIVQQTDDAIFALRGGIAAQRELKRINYAIDAVVIDIAMDDMDGITLSEHIRRNESIRSIEPGCLLFWFTGFPVNSTMEKLKVELKITEIFLKPMDPLTLVSRVKGYLMMRAAA